MEVKDKISLKDWAIMAVPHKMGSDTLLIKELAKGTELTVEPKIGPNEPSLFNNQVALRQFEWHESFLDEFEHAPFDHPSIKKAEQLISLWPEVYKQCGSIIHAFNPVLIRGIEDDKNYGGSNSHQPKETLGAIWATVHNPVLLAQAIVHEMAHNKLFSIGQHFESTTPLFTNQEKEVFDSPIRLDIPRPISAVFHGIYAFTHVLALDRIMHEKAKLQNKKQLLGLLKLNALRVKKGVALIEKCAQLTVEGEAFVGSFLKWAKFEIKAAFEIVKEKNPIKTKTPILIVGPNSQEKVELTKVLSKVTGMKMVNAAELCWDIWAKSSVFKQKRLALFGSPEISRLLSESNKFSNQTFIQNWIRAKVFSQEELEFMKLQLANHLIKNNPNSIIYFDETHVLLELPDFLKRLQKLFSDHNARVVYARPLCVIDEAAKQLDLYNSEEQQDHIKALLTKPAYRTLSAYTFDTETYSEDSLQELVRDLSI